MMARNVAIRVFALTSLSCFARAYFLDPDSCTGGERSNEAPGKKSITD